LAVEIDPQHPLPAAAPAAAPRAVDLAANPLLDLATAVVRLYKQTFGRGPTKARALYAGHDALLILLHDALTVAEHSLLRSGHAEAVHADRRRLEATIEPSLRRMVEERLSREAVACAFGLDPSHDLATIVITLHPRAA
jgi:uncharacterized protein YbcI